MDQITYQKVIDSTKPDSSTNEVIKTLCEDLGVECKTVEPYHLRLFKLGRLDMHVMTINLTTCTGNSWLMGNTLTQVRNQIIKNFTL